MSFPAYNEVWRARRAHGNSQLITAFTRASETFYKDHLDYNIVYKRASLTEPYKRAKQVYIGGWVGISIN